MLTPFCLLFALAAVALSQGGKTAQDCTVGDKWTENYIRFECYQGTGLVVKGVRPIGCVPSNSATGAMIQSGATFDEQYFTYSCSISGGVASYQIINCRDTTGKALAVGESRVMSDASTWKCYKDVSGAIKLSQEKPGGCEYDGKTYAVGQTWTQPVDFKAMVAGTSQSIGKAVIMECRNAGVQGLVAQAKGCVTTTGTNLSNGAFGTVNTLYVKCMVATNGTVTMSVVSDEDVSCKNNGATVKNNEKYTSPDGTDEYICVYGVIKKTGCYIKKDGKSYFQAQNSYVYLNGTVYFCNAGAGVVDFKGITGCTLPDGSIKEFYATWVNGTEVDRCRYSISGQTVTTYIEILGCSYDSKTVYKNDIYVKGTELKKCALVNNVWTMRDLTTAEYTAYIASKNSGGSSNVIGGSGGSGSGGDITAKPTTTITTTTTTVPPMVETTARPTPATTTTTRVATQPATVPTTTTTTTHAPEPSTEAPRPSTRAPSTVTLEPSTTRPTTHPVTVTASTGTASSSTSASTVTLAPSTATPGQCTDLFDMCSTLAPICHDSHNSSVSNLRAIIKTMNVTAEQIKEIFSAMGIDRPVATASDEEREEMEEVVRGLVGEGSEEEAEEEDCGCRDDSCASRCQRRRKPSCKKCQIFKRKVRELVVMVCPSTCGSCGAVGKVPAIIKALVRFYTHDCR